MNASELAKQLLATDSRWRDLARWLTWINEYRSEYERRAARLEAQIAGHERRLAEGRERPTVLKALRAGLPEKKEALAVWQGLVTMQATGTVTALADAMERAPARDHLWRQLFCTIDHLP